VIRVIRATVVIALLWAVIVWVTGGATIDIAGVRVSSTDPGRPMIAAALLAAIYAFALGAAAAPG
jgi:hypothetical protein